MEIRVEGGVEEFDYWCADEDCNASLEVAQDKLYWQDNQAKDVYFDIGAHGQDLGYLEKIKQGFLSNHPNKFSFRARSDALLHEFYVKGKMEIVKVTSSNTAEANGKPVSD